MKAASRKYKRINICIPVETLQLLEEVAPLKKRNQFIAKAITKYVSEAKYVRLRKQLRAGYLANAESDRQIAEECSS